MMNLPKPVLGEITALTIATPDLEVSLAFYKLLGFKELYRAEWPFPWIQITDGVLLIMLKKGAEPYLALTYYVKDIIGTAKLLEAKGLQFDSKPKKGDKVQRYLLVAPDGLNISLVGSIDGFAQPKGPGMLQMDPQDYFKPSKYVNKVCGLFGELAQPVADLAISIEFWKLLGFLPVSEYKDPYNWAILTDGLSVIGLHQSNRFSTPAITYFAADMKAKVEKLKAIGVKVVKEESPGSVEILTPEGQQVFLYALGGGELKEVENQISDIPEITLKPVAFVKNIRQEPIDDNWGSIVSEITLVEAMPEEAFNGISGFSHLEVIYYFNQVRENDIVYSGRPRGNPGFPIVGIFAQRKKDRPNKIGLCQVKLLAHNGKTITVSGLDAIDGTPILDIKPVIKEFQTDGPIKQPEWVAELMKNYWS